MFFDEAGVYLDPTIIASWAPVGKQPQYPTDLRRRRVNLAGWTAPTVGRCGVEQIERGNTENFIGVLPKILDAFKKYHTIKLILDNASWHKSKPVKQFLTEHTELDLVYLPPYSPKLNPQEAQWRYMRQKTTHCRRFETVDECWGAISRHFESMSPERVVSLCSLI